MIEVEGLRTQLDQACHFSVYRTEEVAMTSTLFVGGAWHWCLADASEHKLVDSGGYRTEQECRQAISILQNKSATAAILLDWSQSSEVERHEI